MATYAKPEVLVDSDWVKTNLGQPRIKLVEIDVDTKAYDAGHIPGAVGFNWQTQLQDQVRRDTLTKEAFESLVGGAGISPEDTVILYGDNNNWFAAHGFWLFKLYGHNDVRLMALGLRPQKWAIRAHSRAAGGIDGVNLGSRKRSVKVGDFI
jgi:thiosulfate/3-mercaptopyruvate sulfurtransferase